MGFRACSYKVVVVQLPRFAETMQEVRHRVHGSVRGEGAVVLPVTLFGIGSRGPG
jgi:hypothetical protein